VSSRFWLSLLVAVLVAALVYVVTRRVFGVTFLLLPLFFVWGGSGRDR
jgi:hypothetical protein